MVKQHRKIEKRKGAVESEEQRAVERESACIGKEEEGTELTGGGDRPTKRGSVVREILPSAGDP